MATSSEPFLNTPKRKTFSFKSLYIFLALAAVVCSIAIVSIVYFHGSNNSFLSVKSPNICEHATDQSSCLAIVSEVITPYSASAAKNKKVEILQMILHKTSSQIQETTTFIKNVQLRINDKREQSSLAICLELMDMSREKIMDSMVALGKLSTSSSNSIYFDAHTWLSAVLTNHNTCMDELHDGEAQSIMKPILKDLMSRASASLALMVTLAPKNLEVPIQGDFPSWVSPADREILEANSELAKINANVVVAKDGSGKYKTLNEAIASAPANSNSRYVIYIKKGWYKENVVIASNKKNIMLLGDGREDTVITGNLNYAAGTGTFNTPTVACNADGFIAQNIRFQNSAGPQGHQAVALRVTGDKSVINRCKIDAYQDTLYAHNQRQFYKDCYITGTVDFIFGNAAVVFQKCNIVARKPMKGQQNMLTAQGKTDKNQNTGTSIQKCSITPSKDLAPVKESFKTFLGRPWKIYSTTVFMESYIDNHIDPAGWAPWDGNVGLDTLYYGEYKNNGPGSDTSKRVTWKGYHVITKASEAMKFTVSGLLQGGSWIKDAGVSFIPGL
ncbi:pectinesterase-like [Lycium ferocissimum]|uniref:pectinesterase-like n=1 Tax=Lycium ferocissimum TaxID=112874 RepID=UPI00281532F2|nr:pectinesterase-like [Lycium ferocissimum]